MTRKIVIGSRRSKLAMTQTRWVIDRLRELDVPYSFEICEIVTKGDRIVDRMLSKVGGKGLFIKEIEQALQDKRIDLAVHSMKDVPAELEEPFVLASIPKRANPRDVLISEARLPLEDLPPGSVIGTSSLRRSAQVLHTRPDLKIQWIRGNIDTRLKKLREENFDAIILAAAGLERVGWSRDKVTQMLPVDVCLPAVGQGALGLECRRDDQEVIDLVRRIHDEETGLTVSAERAFLKEMGGSCEVPVAGYAVWEPPQRNDNAADLTADQAEETSEKGAVNTASEDGDAPGGTIYLTGLVASPDGKQVYKGAMKGSDPRQIGIKLAEDLKGRGAAAVLELVKKEYGKE